MPESALNLLRTPNEQTRSYPEHSCIPVKETGQGQRRVTSMAVGNIEGMPEERVAGDRALCTLRGQGGGTREELQGSSQTGLWTERRAMQSAMRKELIMGDRKEEEVAGVGGLVVRTRG